jgi:hypothetical protein
MKKGFIIAILIVLVATLLSCSPKTMISHEELVDLFQIRQWVVPIPKDQSLQWAFKIRDFESVEPFKGKKDSSVDSSLKAKIVFMPTGQGNVYRFWLMQRNGTSSGFMRIDVCDNPSDISKKCDGGQFQTTWYKEPLKADDKTYVLCEIKETFSPSRKKQVVLYLTGYRIEDKINENK